MCQVCFFFSCCFSFPICVRWRKSQPDLNNIGFTLSLELALPKDQEFIFFEGHVYLEEAWKVYFFFFFSLANSTFPKLPPTVYRLWSWPFYNLTFGLVHSEFNKKSSKFVFVFFCSSWEIFFKTSSIFNRKVFRRKCVSCPSCLLISSSPLNTSARWCDIING